MQDKEETFFDSQMMFICDHLTFKILDINRAVTTQLGYSRNQILGRKLSDLGEQISRNQYNGIATNNEEDYWLISRRDSEELIVQFTAYLIGYKGNPAKMVIAHDVTDKYTNHSHNNSISSRIGIYNFPYAEIEWTKNMEVIRWSKKAEELFGWTENEAIKNRYIFHEFIYPEDIAHVRKELETIIKSRATNMSFITRNSTIYGETIYCEWHNSLLYDSHGVLVSIYSLVYDVSARIEAIEIANRSHKSYKDLFNAISDGIYLMNKEGKIVEANEGMEHTFGYARQEIIGQNHTILSAPGKFDEERFSKILHDAHLGNPVKYNGWGRKKNGEVFPSEFLVNCGNYFGEEVYIIVERDVSENLRAEEALRNREQLFSELFHMAPIGIALLNHHTEIEMVNRAFEQIFGYEADEIKGLEIDKLIIPDETEVKIKKFSKGDISEELIGRRRTKSGEIKDMIIYYVPVNVDGKTVATYGIYVDITDRKRAEDELLSSLREKEVLLAEIHHRVKNNLAVITGLLELQSYSTDNENVRTILVESQMRIHSIALVHEKLYQSVDLSRIQIHNYIRDLTSIISKTYKDQCVPVSIMFDLDEVLLSVTQAIPCGLLLNEILTNSYKHAFDEQKTGQISIYFKEHGNDLVFSIRDNGIGLPERHKVQSTHSLGMTLIKTLAKQLKASTNIRNEDGAVFEFTFTKKEIQ